jgi:hypothetical protein
MEFLLRFLSIGKVMLSFLDRREINEAVGWGGGKYETAQHEISHMFGVIHRIFSNFTTILKILSLLL